MTPRFEIISPTEPIQGRVVMLMPAGTPRSYVVQTPTGEVRRNHSQLRVIPETDPSSTMEPEENQHQELPLQSKQTPAKTPGVPQKEIMTQSKTGTKISPPDRLKA